MSSGVTLAPQRRNLSEIVDPSEPRTGRRISREVLLTDLARFVEGLKSRDAICNEHGLHDDEFELVTGDREIIDAVQVLMATRVRTGAFVRERAAQELREAPGVLGSILSDSLAPSRSRIDAAKELRAQSGVLNDGDAVRAEKVVVIIDLGNQKIQIGPHPAPLLDAERGNPFEIVDPERALGDRQA